MLTQQIDNGIRFVLHGQMTTLGSQDNKVTDVQFEDGLVLPTDAMLCFPNVASGNMDFLDQAVNLENMELDQFNRVKVDPNQRTEHKRIFAVGSNCITNCFLTDYQTMMETYGHNMLMHQGQIAAYNILALRIPYNMTPFVSNSQF